ncbi:MAG: LacI family DNA-binding transcriptional regulator, partial [Pseudomonadales bacterium]|nr:LacI family DNA-binding transcriptional regulator [Pseudomonadales bacterium]
SKKAVPKITDVAKAAGVSPATVSRVLNGSSGVSEPLKRKVKKAAAKLGYVPFSSARVLRRQNAPVWAAIVSDIENPFFPAVVRGIEDVAREVNHRLVLCNADENLERESAYIDVAIAERMAGVVIAVASTKDSSLKPLIDRDVPVVAIDRFAGRDIDTVMVDNRHGAQEAVAHLIEGGSRRIACITGPTRVDTANERLDGYRRALAAAGIGGDPKLIRRVDYKEAGGHEAALSLLTARNPPDALFVANSPMAAGVLRAIRELGLTIPRDVAIAAFDDSPWCSLISPQLTVVSQPAYEMGRVAAELLVTANEKRSARTIVLTPELIVRQSSIRR